MTLKSCILLLLLLALASAAIEADLVKQIPGYPSTFAQKLYSGYLQTSSSSRKLHYLFLESSKKETTTPVTLWLNGGPGCSSLLGFLQEIGPFFLEEGVHYKAGDSLSENPYSWDRQSHLLFIQSPAGVGYSINTDSNFQYTDSSTAEDNMAALLDFFTKYSEYSSNSLWIAGESYAGKYIPDLAKKIDEYNIKATTAVNLKGILVGNGLMSFKDGTLEENTIEYIVNHDFIDPDLLPYYRGSCLVDPGSAGCRYFKTRYRENIDEINPYNVYSYCFYNDSFMESTNDHSNGQGEYRGDIGDIRDSNGNRHSQASILTNIVFNNGSYNKNAGNNGPTCAYFDGLLEYFNAHLTDYHAQVASWNGPCAENITGQYSISLRGSMDEYRYLLDRLDKYHIILYSGDWDSVVPFSDTMQNIEKLDLQPTDIYKPFFANGQHAGWTQIYGGLLFVRMKGASHQVPQSKRAEAYELFKLVLESLGDELVSVE